MSFKFKYTLLGDPDGKEFDKLYEEGFDNVAFSDILESTCVLSETRVGESNFRQFKCSASETESDDSEITTLILASNFY